MYSFLADRHPPRALSACHVYRKYKPARSYTRTYTHANTHQDKRTHNKRTNKTQHPKHVKRTHNYFYKSSMHTYTQNTHELSTHTPFKKKPHWCMSIFLFRHTLPPRMMKRWSGSEDSCLQLSSLAPPYAAVPMYLPGVYDVVVTTLVHTD